MSLTNFSSDWHFLRIVMYCFLWSTIMSESIGGWATGILFPLPISEAEAATEAIEEKGYRVQDDNV